MPTMLSCLLGHQWQAPEDLADHDTDTLPPCPVCGAAAQTVSISPTLRSPALASAAVGHPFPKIAGYEIEGLLGRGGMGVVYRARQLALNRPVALKMILAGAHAGPEDLLRFLGEAEAAARLQHPNIVPVYEVGRRDGCPYFTAELVEGGTLAQQLAGKPQPARRAAELLEVLARAVHYAHGRGIIHRDLKPANVLLTADGTPKVTDFGLAKRLEGGHDLTQSGAVVGTPSYMAPEQAAGVSRKVGPAVDVYALGAILYELLTGRPPFDAETPWDTVLQVLTADPVPVRRLQPKAPRDLETIALKCLEKEPRKRYASAEALADDLGRSLRGEPIRASRHPWWAHLLKWARRHPGAAAGAVVSLLVTTVSFVLILAQLERVEAARQDETAQRLSAETARDAERKARLAEQAERAKAEAMRRLWQVSFERARTAVDKLTKFSVELRHLPQGEIVRKEVLQSAVQFYREILQEKGDDPDVRHARAVARVNLGGLLENLDRPAEAEKTLDAGIAILAKLSAEYPGDPAYRKWLAGAYFNQSLVWGAAGITAAAEKALRRARALQKELADQFPAVPEYRADLGKILNDLAVYVVRVNPRAAELLWQEARDVLREAVRADDTKPDYRYQLARTYYYLGVLGAGQRRLADAEKEFGQAVRLLEKVTAERPSSLVYRRELARSLANKGGVYWMLGRNAEAEPLMRRAVEVFAALPKALLDPATSREAEACSYGLSSFLFNRKKDQEAKGLLLQAIAHQQAALKATPSQAADLEELLGSYAGLTRVLLRQKDHAAVAATVEEVLTYPLSRKRDLCTAACFLARCVPLAEQDARLGDDARKAAARRYADRAVTLLREAIAAGYDDLAGMQQDRDLIPLRAREDFQALLRQLKEKRN